VIVLPGLVWSLSPLAAYAASAAAVIFYGWLSLPFATGMLAVLALMLAPRLRLSPAGHRVLNGR
jgi:hypothetical protein